MIIEFFVYVVRPHIYEFQSVIADEGATTELVCHSRGSPIPQLHFRKFGESDSLNVGNNVSLFCSSSFFSFYIFGYSLHVIDEAGYSIIPNFKKQGLKELCINGQVNKYVKLKIFILW